MKKKTLWILCGCPGSGKTYWAEQHKNDHTIWVSRDEIRFSYLDEKEDYFANENTVYKDFIREIQRNLDKGNNVIADATHLNWASRNKLISNLDLADTYVIAVWFKTSLETCVSRNSTRTGRKFVPKRVLIDMHNRRQHPRKDPYKYFAIYNHYEDGTEVLVE